MSKKVLRLLFLGVLVACASACGVDVQEEPSAAVSPEDLGAAEQNICLLGSPISTCRKYVGSGTTSPNCAIPAPYLWTYSECYQYQSGSAPNIKYYADGCVSTQKRVCGGSSSVPPAGACLQTC
jgi:hypothetical protein